MRYRVDPTFALLREELDRRGWRSTDGDDWHLRWDLRHPTPEDFRSLRDGQRIDSFPDSRPLTNKCSLSDSLNTARRLATRHGGDNPYDFAPPGYVLPRDYEKLLLAAGSEADSIWISKPSVLSGGRGIRLTSDVATLEPARDTIVQRYLCAPHLMNARKYTLRFFVLVTRLDPLVLYRYGEGLVKFTTRPFTTARELLDDHFVHLTNPDVLLHDADAEGDLERVSHALYRERLREAGCDDGHLWDAIDHLIILTFMAARDAMITYAQREALSTEQSFQLFGLDLLIDETLKPWLLECNFSPSLYVDGLATSRWAKLERGIKSRLIGDTISLACAGVDGDGEGPEAQGAQSVAAVLAAESTHRGAFKRLIPGAASSRLLHFMPLPRHLDLAFAVPSALSASALDETFEPLHAAHFPVDDHLLLLPRQADKLLLLNATAAFIWLSCAAGCSVSQIIAELQTARPEGNHAASAVVRDTIAGWVSSGLVVPAGLAEEYRKPVLPAEAATDDAPIARWTSGVSGKPGRRWLLLGRFDHAAGESDSHRVDALDAAQMERVSLRSAGSGRPRLFRESGDEALDVAGIVVIDASAGPGESIDRLGPARVLRSLLAAPNTHIAMDPTSLGSLVDWFTTTPCYGLQASDGQSMQQLMCRIPRV